MRDGLALLLRRLGRLDGIRWIRVMYAYPATVTDGILDAIASEDKVVKYVHIPLQHASEPVLQRMKRSTGKGNLLGLVERMRERVPGVALRTSFIVGFPGETEQEFQETLSLVEECRFDSAFTFIYSPRRRTAAAGLPGRLPAGAGEERLARLVDLVQRLGRELNEVMLGQMVEVLVERINVINVDIIKNLVFDLF